MGGVVERDARPPTFLLFYLFTLKHCCPVKTFSYGFREAGPLCETHCKPQSGAAVGGQGCKGRFPEGGLMPLTVSRMCKSRFAEHYPSMQLYPQLHRFAACSGFRIEVYLRHTLWGCCISPSVIKPKSLIRPKQVCYNNLSFFSTLLRLCFVILPPSVSRHSPLWLQHERCNLLETKTKQSRNLMTDLG